jgi:hypothetical protein
LSQQKRRTRPNGVNGNSVDARAAAFLRRMMRPRD